MSELEHWTRDDMLAHAVRRGTTLRRRRTALMGTAAAAVAGVLLVGGAVAFAGGGTDGAAKVRTVDRPTTTEPAPTTTTSPPALPAVLASTTTTTVRRPKPTSTTTTSTTVAEATTCAASDAEVVVTTDKPSYSEGEKVHATATVINRSTHLCYPIDEAAWRVEPAGGPPSDNTMHEIRDFGSDAGWPPGSSQTFSFEWTQQCVQGDGCTGQHPRGQYVVKFEGQEGQVSYRGQAAFDLV